MSKYLNLILFLCLNAVVHGTVFSQGTIPTLFEPIHQHDKINPEASRNVVTVDLNSDLLYEISNNRIDQFKIWIHDEFHLVKVDKIIRHYNEDWSIIGSFDGQKFNTFTLSVAGGKASASIFNSVSKENFKLMFNSDLSEYELLLDKDFEDDVLNCGTTRNHIFSSIKKNNSNINGKRDLAHDENVIDLMVVYTPRAREWAEEKGGIQSLIYESLAKGQIALDNSGVEIEINLVYTKEVEYEESELSNGSPDIDLKRLIASPTFNPFGNDPFGSQYSGYLDEVHEMRDEYSADLVSFFIKTDQVGGLGWVPNEVEGDARYGFSLTRVQQAYFYTHIHEIGHNFGNAHSRLQENSAAGVWGGLFTYSTGWRWVGNDSGHYSSVMTYNEGAQTVPVFSNPNVIHQGVPTGSYEGNGAPADNSRSMREIKKSISGYRVSSDSEPPIVETNQIFNITAGRAEGIGSIIDDREGRINERGICWGKQINPDIFDNCTSSDIESETFQVSLSDLDGNTTYFARAYAKNESTTGYGQNIEFKTFDISSNFSSVVVSENKLLANGIQNSIISVNLKNSLDEPAIGIEVEIIQDGNSKVSAINEITNINGQASFNLSHDSEEIITYQVLAKDLLIGEPFSIEYIEEINSVNLGNNYPNPFNNGTNIPVIIANDSHVKIEIFNVKGAKISTLINQTMDAGYYEFTFNSKNYSSGVYLYQLTSSGVVERKKMLLMK